MIDLHTHTTASDGTVPPAELVRMALRSGLDALAITDHDTLEGWDDARGPAQDLGLDLIAGIELSTRLEPRYVESIKPWLGERRMPSIHLLGYFLNEAPPAAFRSWIVAQQESRHRRNVALIERLQSFGLDITLPEVSALGRNLTGRPHFAQVMLRKGYVTNLQEAFDLYLADDSKAAVERDEPGLAESIGILRDSGALPVLAHPVRLPLGGNIDALPALLEILCSAGLGGIEVWHSEQSAEESERYLQLAKRFGLESTGGSDFHGANKPRIALGTGVDGNLAIPNACLDRLRASSLT